MENEQEITESTPQGIAVSDTNGASTHVGDVTSEELDMDKMHEAEESHDTPDFASFSKKDFVAHLKELVKSEGNFARIDQTLKEMKTMFDEIRDRAKAEALQKFKQEGGHENDFEFRSDEFDIAFDANFKLIRDKRNAYFKGLEDQKNENLHKKNQLLERLRTLVDGEDSEHSFRTFKEIQTEWKKVGQVAAAQVRPLWASYQALVDRFYDQRSIYFELKELDRKKNLEIKNELCVRAEKLDTANLNAAVRELNELHNEFKHVGPVPLDAKDAVWQRFKAASDAVYQKRDEFLAHLQTELKANLEKKNLICDEVAPFVAFTSDKIKEWNQKTKEILELQKRWDALGAVPRNKAKDINKNFWGKFKQFFHNKNQFFKKLDEERSKNLALKQELIAKAKQLQESNDWEKTARTLKDLQQQWKEVGPVPERQREKVYQEFKVACDYFFDHRRTQLEQADKEQEENLAKKMAVLAEFERVANEGTGTREQMQELQAQFNAIGFVPKKSIAEIRDRYNQLTQKFLSSIKGLSDSEKEQVALEVQMSGLKNDPNADRKIFHKEQTLRKQIQKAENDIAVLRNNLEFFGRSKNADKVRDEFNAKINEASEQLVQLKKQLKILQTAS